MRKCVVAVLVLIIIAMLVSGCGQKQSVRIPTTEEKAIVAKYDALPESTKLALKAKNLVGLTVYSASSNERCTVAVEILIRNGARRASDQKSADLVITKREGGTALTITDKHGNRFYRTVASMEDAEVFAQEVADTLGAEGKIGKVREPQEVEFFNDRPRRALDIK